MKTVVIIQARMTSKRLPGKMMMPLGSQPVLEHVIERCKRIKLADDVVCAFPVSNDSRPMISCARSLGVTSYVGSEKDVLKRFRDAAVEFKADIVVRITGDCPLIDPAVVDEVIALRKYENAHYASNVWPRSYPKGLDCEVFTINKLIAADQEAKDEYDREHVTPWIVRHTPRVNLASGRFDLARFNWSLDTQADLRRLQAIFALGNPSGLNETLALQAAVTDYQEAS